MDPAPGRAQSRCNRPMRTDLERRKTIPAPERIAALAAITTARLEHKHVGVRPKRERNLDKRTAGIRVPPESNPGTGLDEALDKASQSWPDDNSWEVFGADALVDFPDDEFCDELADGCFDAPCVCGEFTTTDEPGWAAGS